MSRLLEEAIGRLRELPEDMQEVVARQLIQQLDEEPEADGRLATQTS